MEMKLRKVAVASPFRSSPDHFDDDDDDYSSNYSDEYSIDNIETASNSGKIQTKRMDSNNSSKQEYPNELHTAERHESRHGSIKRMPTRKPDPKISNRNAIMARENRRRKKEHMEVLEKTVEEVQSENKKLRKMLQVRNSKITKLTQEGLYLRSILANKTEIMSLLKSIQGNRTPITSSVLSFVADKDCDATLLNRTRASCSSTGYSPASSSMSPASYEEDDKENGTSPIQPRAAWLTADADPLLSAHTEHSIDLISTDLHSDANERIDFGSALGGGSGGGAMAATMPGAGCIEPLANDFRWETFLNEYSGVKAETSPLHIPDILDIDDNDILSTTSSNTVNIEHNYFNNPITKKVADDCADGITPGVCLHVSSGRVSLEFCASCHINSQNAWCEEM